MNFQKIKKIWDVEIIGNRRKMVFLAKLDFLYAPTYQKAQCAVQLAVIQGQDDFQQYPLSSYK